ncbi:RNA polymerase sigma-70 factor, ECF subfamily [Ruminococcaceae bacterium FB2012]|nr:RNA polymerase sigma-70 factor, ECF subfamily [Ruminococcaceae bacterium FB2012]
MQRGPYPVSRLEDVIGKYKETVYGIALSHLNSRADADDVFQETFLLYHTKAPQFDDEKALKAWLVRTALNLCRSSNSSIWNTRVDKDPDAGADVAVHFGSREEDGIWAAVRSLEPKYRTAVYLFYFEDMSVREIAKALGITEAAVQKRLSRARKKLRTKLEGDYFG